MRLTVLDGGRSSRPTVAERHSDRVLHPRAALGNRAGITPTRVPSDMWVAPRLVATMSAPRLLRAVA